MFEFGSGTLWITPVSGNLPANPTPIMVGTLQDVSLDIQFDLKMLYGTNNFPEAIARGKGKITGKAKFGRFNSDLINQILFAQTRLTGTEAAQKDEAHTIGGSPAGAILTGTVVAGGTGYSLDDIVTVTGGGGTGGTFQVTGETAGVVSAVTLLTAGSGYTATTGATTTGGTGTGLTITTTVSAGAGGSITVTNSATFVLDAGVRYASTGAPFRKVTALTGAGQYIEVGNSGVYQFGAPDGGQAVLISYINTVASAGVTQNIVNQQMGTEPIVTIVFRTIFNNQEAIWFFYAGVVGKLTMASKLDDFTVPEIDFECFANSAGQVLSIYAAE